MKGQPAPRGSAGTAGKGQGTRPIGQSGSVDHVGGRLVIRPVTIRGGAGAGGKGRGKSNHTIGKHGKHSGQEHAPRRPGRVATSSVQSVPPWEQEAQAEE